MNTFRKHNDAWVVQVLSGATTGDTVAVTLRNGGSKQVTLGARVGDALYAVAARAPAAAAEAVGDLSRIIAMFDRAQQHLRHPAIVLDGFRVNIAGQRAREPGSLTITSSERTQAPRAFAGRPGMQREWLGRVTRAGMFEAGRNAPAGLGEKLRRFAADPAGEAAAHGRMHGVCCFCNSPLRDERSTAVGYGPICADHFGLPWGAREAAPAAAPIAENPPQYPAHAVA